MVPATRCATHTPSVLRPGDLGKGSIAPSVFDLTQKGRGYYEEALRNAGLGPHREEARMSEVQRRDVLVGTVGVAAAALTAVKPAEGGDSSFLNNVPDPVLSGDALPTLTLQFMSAYRQNRPS